ncbi:MAG: PH domain-containing protein [Propionibacteriaceae bacterium]|jgi:putative membrane protein|nr:PH domain-containing protein [Propionibacteriaceae bacterium]
MSDANTPETVGQQPLGDAIGPGESAVPPPPSGFGQGLPGESAVPPVGPPRPAPTQTRQPAPGGPPPADAGQPPGGVKRTERAHPLTPLIRGWLILVAVVVGLVNQFMPRVGPPEPGEEEPRFDWLGQWQWIALAVVGVIIVAVIAGYFSWRFTKFVIDDEELRVETGAVFRKSQRIAFTKVQSIDIVQPFAARVLGLAELQIDTASTEAVKLRYLGVKRAHELRDYLLNRAAVAQGRSAGLPAGSPGSIGWPIAPAATMGAGPGAQSGVVAAGASPSAQPAAASGVPAALPPQAGVTFLAAPAKGPENVPFLATPKPLSPERVLLRVPPGRLVLAAVTSHEFILMVAVFAAVVVGGIATADSWGLWAMVGTAFAVLSASGSFLVRRFISQFGYELTQRPEGLRITRGLTSVTSQALPARRVQAVQLAQSLLWRKLGFYRVDLEVIGWGDVTNAENKSGVSTIMLPVGTWDDVQVALRALWPNADHTQVPVRVAPKRARWLHPFSAPFLRWGFDGHFFVSLRGWLVRRWQLVPTRRAQSFALVSGPVSRRFGLVDIEVHTAGMHLAIKAEGVDQAEATAALPDIVARLHDRAGPDVADPPAVGPAPESVSWPHE